VESLFTAALYISDFVQTQNEAKILTLTNNLERHMSTSVKISSDLAGKSIDPSMYRSMIGSLMYLTASRPDIAFSVGVCARFQANPKESHLTAVKRIIRYVNDTLLTPNIALTFYMSPMRKDIFG
jgi:hypothetical protein